MLPVLMYVRQLSRSVKFLGYWSKSAQIVVNAVWLPLLAAGAIPNLVYCIYLLARQGTWANFRSQRTPAYLALAMVMAILWFFSTALYGVVTTKLGELGVVVGWPVFMSLIVFTAGLLGIFTGEWKRSGTGPIALQIVGLVLLVLAVVVLSRAQRSSSTASALHRTPRPALEIRINRMEAGI